MNLRTNLRTALQTRCCLEPPSCSGRPFGCRCDASLQGSGAGVAWNCRAKSLQSVRRSTVVAAQNQTSPLKEPQSFNKVEADAAHQACSDFLRSLGVDNRAELARILDIATNPNSLFHTYRDANRDTNPLARRLSVEDDLKPVAEYLLSESFSQEDVCKVVIAHPAVLCYSPDSRLRPFFDYLRSLGIEHPQHTVLQRPSLLGLTVDKNLRQMIEYLQQNDYSTEKIEQLLASTL